MKTILVIGGGITGLSAMHELHKWKEAAQKDVRLVLAESSAELGGKIRTVKKSDFVIETGADSMVARKANMMTFIEELGLSDEVVYNATGRSFIYTDGELKLIPANAVFGIPAGVESLVSSTLVSAEGKVAALKDLYTKNDRFTKHDSIGEFLEFFLGKELVEKQIAPVLSGVYSGALKDLTIASTLPYVLDYKNEYGSIMKGLEANLDKFQSGDKKFLSFKNGFGALVDAFEEKLEGYEIFKHVRAVKIEKADGCYHVFFSNGEMIEADHIILSIPHDAAEALLDDEVLKQEFANLKNSSLISVYAGFDVPDHLLPADGTGFITSGSDELWCNACTWTSRKWEHTSKSRNLLVRLFYKSSHPSYPVLQNMNDEELLQIALRDIYKSLRIEQQPIVSEITRWSESLPNYLISHPKSVEALEARLEEAYPGIMLAGCSYYGVGVPDCIQNGEDIAKKVIDRLI